MGFLKRLFANHNPRNCDKCNKMLPYPDGYLFDASTEDLETWSRLANFANFAAKMGAQGVSSQSDPFWFVCEKCLTKFGSNQGSPVDIATKMMSSARAMHLWDNEEWDRPMLPVDFPSESYEEQLPWLSSALEEKWKNEFGPEPPLENYLATRASILARLLVQRLHKASYPNDEECVTKPVDFAVVIQEMTGHDWGKCLQGIVERHLLEHVSATTEIRFASYRDSAKTWFSHRMLPYVATSVVNALGLSVDNLHFYCRIDNKGSRCLTLIG